MQSNLKGWLVERDNQRVANSVTKVVIKSLAAGVVLYGLLAIFIS